MMQSNSSAEPAITADGYIGPYKLGRQIAQDGIGQIFEATDLVGKKRVAIKRLWPHVAELVEPRLYSEADTVAQLNHPHVARLFGFVRRGDQVYLVMEFIEGESLKALLKRKGRLEPNVALAFFRQILSAVGFAHRLGVIHGGLRPSLIMLTKLGTIKVLDFPMAPLLDGPDLTLLRIRDRRYMPPEQPSVEPGDARLDVYSLGVLLYEMIVGDVPFDGAKNDIVRAETAFVAPSLLTGECPSWLDAFLFRALALWPSERFQSVAAMIEALSVPIKFAGPSWPVCVGIRLRQAAERGRVGIRLATAAAAGHLASWRTVLAAAIVKSRRNCHRLARSFQPATPMRCWAMRITRSSRLCQRHIRHGSLAMVQLLFAAERIIVPRKRILTLRFETGGKRYAALAILVVSVLLEPVFFGDTGTLRPIQRGPHKRHDRLVQQPHGRPEITRVASKSPPHVAKKSAEPKNIRRQRRVRKPLSQGAAGEVEQQPERLEAAAVHRKRLTAMDRAASKKPTDHSAFQQHGAHQPVFTSVDTEADSSRIQLNVKWEN